MTKIYGDNMSHIDFEVRKGAYYDSVVLMQLQRSLADIPGVVDAGLVMATQANKELLAASDLLPAGAAGAGADDLLIVIKGESAETASGALGQLDDLIRQRRSQSESQGFRPRSLANAVKMLPDAEWVLISVPGKYAAGVAQEALDLGKHVFLYSDNVSLDDELRLKEKAQKKGLLLMGPDCGTAIINGVGLGFANRVRRGNIGIVAASGTGLQAISTHIHNAGSGVSHAIGTGGRDLSTEVRGITALQALDVLSRDPESDVIVFVSKPPAPVVVTRLLAAAAAVDKPVVFYLMGIPPPGRQIGNLQFAVSLQEAAQLAVDAAEWPEPLPHVHNPASLAQGKHLRALMSGGTLAYELVIGLQSFLYPLYTNVPLRPEQTLANVLQSKGHTIVDMGDDLFTQGRLHPMMDNDLRIRRLQEEAARDDAGLIVLDVVLGEGAHPNPASELAPAIESALKRREIEIAILLVGTDEDPQVLDEQARQFVVAGATVFYDVRALVEMISRSFAPPDPIDLPAPIPITLLQKPFSAINVGLETFVESLTNQDAEVVPVEWRPPAGGNEKMMALLARMKSN
jgi:FdrA protein